MSSSPIAFEGDLYPVDLEVEVCRFCDYQKVMVAMVIGF
jgi:hypothetical protein